MSPDLSAPARHRALGLVIAACLVPERRAGLDEDARARLRALAGGDEADLDTPFAELGIDSLSWMAVLTELEESLATELDDDGTTSSGGTPRGLAALVAQATSVPADRPVRPIEETA